MLDSVSLFDEFVDSFLHSLLGDLIVHVDALDHGDLSVVGRAWEGEDEVLWYTVLSSVGLDSNGLPLLASEFPVSQVVDGGVSSGGGGGEFSQLDNFGTSLLDSWGEFVLDPVGGDESWSRFSSAGSVSNIWVHGWRVVSPNGKLLDILNLGSGLESKLGHSSVLIKSSHGSELVGVDTLGVVLEDEAVGVGWVSNNDSLAVSLGVISHSFSYINKDFSVLGQKVRSLHTWSSWLGSNHEGVVDVLHSNRKVRGGDNIFQKWESAIMKLGLDSGESVLHHWQVEHVKDDSLVLS